MIKIKTILYFSFTLLLSSCSVHKGSFDCKAHKGIGCESVSKVNELVDDDKLDEFTNGTTNKKSSNKTCSCQDAKLKNKKASDPNEEKITIHFNQYKEKGIIHKESEIEVGAK